MVSNICIIPIRKGSKGIKNKNIKLFNGKPLAYYTIQAALKSKIFDLIIVAHNSEIYKKKLIKYFLNEKKIDFFRRSEKNADDFASTESVLEEVLIKKNYYHKKITCFLIQATSPLLKSSDLILSLKTYKKNKLDSLFSSYKKKIFLWKFDKKKNLKPIDEDPFLRKRKQLRSFVYIENGAFYIFKTLDFLKFRNRLNGKVGTYCIPELRSIEIDDLDEFNTAKKIHKLKI